MALVLFEDTFLTMAEADALLQDSAWATATEADREEALRDSTQALNYSDWASVALSGSQTLAWPREAFSYWDYSLSRGVEVAEGEVPARLKRAVANLALHYIKNPSALEQTPSFDSFTIGPLSVTDSNPGGRTEAAKIPWRDVTQIILCLMNGNQNGTFFWRRAN